MRKAYLIAAGAGFVSAVALLLSVVAFPPLLLIAGLPLFAVGMVWGYAAALLAAATGTLIVSIGPGDARLVLALFLGLPAVLMTYLADSDRLRLTNQTLAEAMSAQVGRIVLAAAVFGGLFSALMMVGVHDQIDVFRKEAAKAIEDSFKYTSQPAPSASEIAETTESVIRLMPAAIAFVATATSLFNLWAAGRLVRTAQLLRQPWPDLAAFRFPSATPIVLALSLVCALTLSGGPGLIASSLAAALLLAYLVLGLAVIHSITRGKPWRGFALFGLYLGLFWLAIPVIALGLVDTVFPLRRPPSAGSNT